MKFDMSCKVYNWFFSKMLKDYCNNHKLDFDINDYIKDVQKEYKAMIERTPGLAKGNNMVQNLTGAAYFFAIAKVIPNMTPELMNEIVDHCIYSDMLVKMNKSKREKGLIFSDKEQDKMVEGAKKSQTSDYEMDWIYTYEKHPNEYFLTYTKCGVCRLAERENVLEYLPCMCRMDFPKYDIVGANLYRDKTLAKGDECCNFHVVRKTPEELSKPFPKQ